tara:strand:- start:1230 stop:1475 length:246 start_codon:yes stop_codon:yes gene_type:complete
MAFSSSDLVHMSDDELRRRYRSISNMIRNSKFSSNKRQDLEIEYCYIFRELECRQKRVEAHQEYLNSISKSRQRIPRRHNQ